MPIPELERHCGSWIAAHIDAPHPIETFDRATAETLYDAGFVVFTAGQWLARLNEKPKPLLPLVGFYCTMIRGERVAWLAGPFPTKAAAEARVLDARRAAEEVDPRAAWDSFGVTRMERPAPALPLGVLNGALGLPVA